MVLFDCILDGNISKKREKTTVLPKPAGFEDMSPCIYSFRLRTLDINHAGSGLLQKKPVGGHIVTMSSPSLIFQ